MENHQGTPSLRGMSSEKLDAEATRFLRERLPSRELKSINLEPDGRSIPHSPGMLNVMRAGQTSEGPEAFAIKWQTRTEALGVSEQSIEDIIQNTP